MNPASVLALQGDLYAQVVSWKQRAEAAEAEVARLQEQLRIAATTPRKRRSAERVGGEPPPPVRPATTDDGPPPWAVESR